VGLQKPVNAGFRDEVSTFIRERYSNLARGELWPFQGHIDEIIANIVRNAVPNAPRPRTAIFKTLFAEPLIKVVPPIECRP
jgi:hypothetical protein